MRFSLPSRSWNYVDASDGIPDSRRRIASAGAARAFFGRTIRHCFLLGLRFSRKRGSALGWLAMMRRLLISVGKLKDGSFLIRPSHERDSGGKVVACKSRRDRDSRN